jgi:hypothetical protein
MMLYGIVIDPYKFKSDGIMKGSPGRVGSCRPDRPAQAVKRSTFRIAESREDQQEDDPGWPGVPFYHMITL